MRAPLHGGDRHGAGVTEDHLSGVADGGGAGKGGNVRVGKASRGGERIGEGAQAGAEDESDLWAQGRARQDELGGGVSECELVGHVVRDICERGKEVPHRLKPKTRALNRHS